MSRAIFNRMLLLVHGQGDDLETPVAPESWYSHDVGHFHRETELANGIAPDADRVIQPPMPVEADPAWRARVMRQAAAIGVAFWLGLAALLRLFGARSFS